MILFKYDYYKKRQKYHVLYIKPSYARFCESNIISYVYQLINIFTNLYGICIRNNKIRFDINLNIEKMDAWKGQIIIGRRGAPEGFVRLMMGGWELIGLTGPPPLRLPLDWTMIQRKCTHCILYFILCNYHIIYMPLPMKQNKNVVRKL